MWNKLYLGVLAASVAVMTFLTYYAWSWLQSIGQPNAAAAGYEYHTSIAWTALWITVVLLMVLGNAVLWASGKSWAVWASLIYFAVFVVARYFWLDRLFIDFRSVNGLSDGSFSFGPMVAAILILLMASIAFFDQFLIVRLREKTFGKAATAAEPEKSEE